MTHLAKIKKGAATAGTCRQGAFKWAGDPLNTLFVDPSRGLLSLTCQKSLSASGTTAIDNQLRTGKVMF